MGREDPFLVRHSSVPAVGEAQSDRAVLNRLGFQVVTDFYTQLLLSGYCFHMQTGTEDAPITTNGPLDDTKPVIVADITSGAAIPLRAQAVPSALSTGTLAEAMLEADMDKVRYTSGGTAFVPEQMNKAATNASAANGSFYTIEGSDIVAAAKTAVPASVELSRLTFTEDALADTIGYPGAWDKELFNAKTQFPVILTNPGSLLVHFGSATADITGYANLDFAQFPATLAW